MNKFNLKIFGLIILISIGWRAKAQKYSFDKILTEEGKANLSIRQIIQDKNGFLWLATFDGLYRYEGDDHIVQHRFANKGEINSDVTSLARDKDDNIWIGTNKGLSKYNPFLEKIITYVYSGSDSFSISDDKIRCIKADSEGRIWIGTREGGLNVYDAENDRFIRIKIEGEALGAPYYIKSILHASDGKIWLGTWQDGLYCLSISGTDIISVCNYRQEDPVKNISHNFVYCIFEDTDGKIVAGTRNGLNVYDPGTDKITQYHTSTELSDGKMTNIFRSVKRDSNGKLWIGTWGGLILCNNYSDLQKGDFDLIVHDRRNVHSISHDQIMDVFQDKSGSVWIGTENGFNKYDPYQNHFQQISGGVVDHLPEQTATSFHPYKNGMLIATLSNGILFRNEEGSQYFPADNRFASFGEKLYSVFVDSENNVWAGSYSGLLIKMDGRTGAFSTYKHSDDEVPVYVIAEAEDGTLLIGTSGEGLKYFNPKIQKIVKHIGLSGDIEINDILLDKKKNLWITAELGIFKARAGSNSFEFYLPDNDKEVSNPNVFITVAESDDGVVYAGGRNGLYRYNEASNSFSSVELKNTERFWVTNIQFDSEKNMWLNLNFNRIAKWTPNTDQLRFFNVNNGTRSSQYNRRGFFIDNHDILYFSGFDQIYQFQTSLPVENTYSPTPVFTSLTINNTEVHAGTELNNQVILNKNINSTTGIVLTHRNKDFTLSFTSASYLNKNDNKYKYILHGYDNEWHEGSERLAHYTNLSPGKYTFEVFAANNDGLWCASPAKLAIRIKPAPLVSFFAFVIYAILLFLVVFQIRKTVLGRLHLKQELLIERVKREKEEKFHQERLRFYTNISHELRTPLTLIMGPIKQLIAGEKNNATIYKLNHLILDNSQRLLSLVNQLLDFRKSVYEGMKLKTTFSDFIEIIESNIDAFEFMAREKEVSVRFTTEKNVVEGWFDKEKLDIILFNILSNAFKFTNEDGFVEIDLKTLQGGADFPLNHIKLTVLNSGKGIPKHLQEKVFERFYQVNNDSPRSNPGTGIGLSLVKSLIELHHGKITLESEPDGITAFTIYLPFEKQAYSDDEIFDFKRDADRRTKELLENLTNANNHPRKNPGKTDLPKLLIVEDNSELREYLSDYLSDDYQILTANNGFDGLKVCGSENPDLIISDVMMENMDGLQFCKKVKSTPEISHIPVILMTALASVENKMTGYKVGADDYITKPFEPELLKIRAGNLLEKRKNARKDFANTIHITAKELTVSKIDEDFIQKVIDLLENNLDKEGFDIDSICKNMGTSPSYLYRKIKSITGLSPNEFIRTYRLKKAAILIRESKMNVSEIAYKVGFNDALYFSKCFKKQFGIAPSLYAVQQ